MIIYNFFKYLFQHLQIQHIINKICIDEDLLINLSRLFGVEFKKDWIGRIYTIVNPLVNSDPNEVVYEAEETGYNVKRYVEKWVMDRLMAAQSFIQDQTLFEIVKCSIDRLDENYNYLVVFEPITYQDFKKWSKRFVGLVGGLVLIGIILLIIL